MSNVRTSAYCQLSNNVVLNFPGDRRQSLASITLAFRDEEGKTWNERLLMNKDIPIFSFKPDANRERQEEQTENLDDPPTCDRDPSYYFSFFTIEVEDTLYSIPTYQISPLLGGVGFTTPATSEESPVVLEHAQKSDFLAVLKLLHPLSPDSTPGTLTTDEWISVLKIATENNHLRGINMARTMAIDYLARSKISPLERIELGRKYFVYDWVKPNIKLLVQNEEPITRDMVDRIGYKTVEGICRLREQSYRAASGSPDGGFFKNGPRGNAEESSIMRRIFGKDLNVRGQQTFANDDDQIVQRILLAYKSGEQMWLQMALEEMVSCRDVLTAEQAAKLPYVDLAVKIWQARLELRKPSSPRPFGKPPMIFNEEAFEKEFAFELPRFSASAPLPSGFTPFANAGASSSGSRPAFEPRGPSPPLAFASFPNVGVSSSSRGPTSEPPKSFAFTFAPPSSAGGPTSESTRSSTSAPQSPAFAHFTSPSSNKSTSEAKRASLFGASPFGATSPVGAPSSAFGSIGGSPFSPRSSSFGSGGQPAGGTYVFGPPPAAGQASTSFGSLLSAFPPVPARNPFSNHLGGSSSTSGDFSFASPLESFP